MFNISMVSFDVAGGTNLPFVISLMVFHLLFLKPILERYKLLNHANAFPISEAIIDMVRSLSYSETTSFFTCAVKHKFKGWTLLSVKENETFDSFGREGKRNFLRRKFVAYSVQSKNQLWL